MEENGFQSGAGQSDVTVIKHLRTVRVKKHRRKLLHFLYKKGWLSGRSCHAVPGPGYSSLTSGWTPGQALFCAGAGQRPYKSAAGGII